MKRIAYKQMFENELSHGWYLGTRRHLIKTLKQNIKTNARILDAGAGTGGTIKFLRRAGFRNIIGVEKSDIAITYSRQRSLKIQKGDINRLPFKKETFDAVICLDVLYHKGVNLNLAISEFQRVLKNGGLLYIQEPAFNFLKSHHDLAISTERRFTQKTIAKIINESGFKIIKLTYLNTFMFIPIAMKRIIDKYRHTKEISSDVVPLSPALNWLITNSLTIESLLLRYMSFPFGFSIICLAKKN